MYQKTYSKFGPRIFFSSLLTLVCMQAQAGMMGSLPPIAPWDGFYASGLLGGAWGEQDWNYTNLNYFNTLGPVLIGTDFSFNSKSVLGGVNLGYNYQPNDWFVGIEGALMAADLNPTRVSPFFAIDRYTSDLNALGTLKGRFGYAHDEWLFNVNGGLAIANVKLTLRDTLVGISASSSRSWRPGWVLGAGVDRKLTPHFSIGIGYDYSQIKFNKTLTCPSCGTGTGQGTPVVEGKIGIQTLLARCSYWFNA
ncbi:MULTISPECIES: outer membrane protein [Legionella]|uniref:Porin family protein n=1 Tax=Legionella septentrionalis TaxID=2498109 RepID=A0A433JK67_9GAMM|nr:MULTISPECIES: outer membrane beta-barrel protein [Legionella]MCP0914899.1 outer membrane beta-barrel protein [Legionella sp. 27cVA30]RUQ88848.1 porin family protein [Legionella septentrionalis]RUR11559.1 porin family protein [Legionella septentrionalis]